MDALDPDIARSLRGSAARDSVLLAADRRGRAYLEQLAGDAGVDARTARDAILGGLPRYAPELSLVRIGLLRPVEGSLSEFEITPRGAEAAALRRRHVDRRQL